jgi:predicted RNA-binding Zn-ribbon protein involved in translation (DUF1610 family)
MKNTNNTYEVSAKSVAAKVAIQNGANVEWFKDFGWELVPGFYNFDGIKIENPEYDEIVDGELGRKEIGIAQAFKVKCPHCGEWSYVIQFSENEDFPKFNCENCGEFVKIVEVKDHKNRDF